MNAKKRNFWALFIFTYGSANFWAVENIWINLYWERTMGSSPIYVGLMVGVSAVAGVLSQILFGALSDTTKSELGRRRPFILIGSITGGIAMCFFPITRFLSPVIAAVIYGVTIDAVLSFFGDMTTPTRTSFLIETTNLEERGKINAILGIGGAIGITGAVSASGYIIDVFGVDYSFYSGGLTLLASGVAFFFISVDPQVDESEITKNWTALIRETFSAESYQENKSFYILLIFIFFNSIGSNVYGPYLFIYIESVLGIQSWGLAIILGGLALVGFIIGVPIGLLIDKYGRKKILYISMICAALGNITFALIPANTGLTGLLSFAIGAIGVGFGSAAGAAGETWMQDLTPEDRKGSILGFRIIAIVLPMFPGALLGGWLFDVGPKPEGYKYSPIIFIVGAIISLIGLPVIKYVEETLKKSKKKKDGNNLEEKKELNDNSVK